MAFQSPSLRGSGHFGARRRTTPGRSSGFNPLHCGAVVTSTRRRSCAWRRSSGFNPLHCGAVVASEERAKAEAQARRVLIPFIAGQWSLRTQCAHGASRTKCLNPLHCGAVVASRRGKPKHERLRKS